MKNYFKYTIGAAIFLLAWSSCSHSGIGKLVGNNRDDHGCLSSAGYQWSYALNDCIRVWEAGERFDSDQNSIFLVFSPDSTFAEIFANKNKRILCKRKKDTQVWLPPKGNEKVSIANHVITVYVNNFNYTKSSKE